MKPFKALIAVFICLFIWQISFSQKVPKSSINSGEKLFSFGVVADIQYVDAETASGRNYRGSLDKLRKCIDEFNRYNLSFVVTLGDMIDRNYKSYDKPLLILKKSKVPVYNVIGNHDFAVEEKLKVKVKQRLDNKKGYFSFKEGGFTFILLDGTDVSSLAYIKDSPKYKEGMVKYNELKRKGRNNAFTWNGGIGDKQLNWLDKQLSKADRMNNKVVIFCHWPLLPEGYTELWNNRKVLQLLNCHNCVVAWIAGHRHEGSYEEKEGIHHLTVKSVVEAKSETSCGIIEVYRDKLLLNGYGDQENKTLEFPN